jgi:hypothetical protein
MGRRINEIDKATFPGKIETQMGNGGRAGRATARGLWAALSESQDCFAEPIGRPQPAAPAGPPWQAWEVDP